MRHFVNRLIEKAIANSQSYKIAKLQIKNEWSPDIVISRDPGSGGKLIARKIASKLDWTLFDKALMLKLSKELNIDTSVLTGIDEHGRTWFNDLFQSIFNPSYVSDVRYISLLKKILLHAAKMGNMVILGRGANIILPHDKCLRVRITASYEKRVANTYEYEHLKSKEEAKERVSHVQLHRNQFIRQYFGVNPHNPWNYDLVISTDHLTIDQSRDLIISAFKAKFPKESKALKM